MNHLLNSLCSLSITDGLKSSVANINYWKLYKHATQTEILITFHLESSFKTIPGFRKNPILSFHRCLSQLFVQQKKSMKCIRKYFINKLL